MDPVDPGPDSDPDPQHWIELIVLFCSKNRCIGVALIDTLVSIAAHLCRRLMLMGGAAGLLDLMVEEGVAPDIKTLSILLQIQNSR